MRFAVRKDLAQARIVATLRAAGVLVEIMHTPCDLLTYVRGRWLPLEVKTPTKTGKIAKDKRQKAQRAFLEATGCPVVTTPEEALKAVGIVYEGDLL